MVMEYRILGISGSPVKNGNVETFLQKTIESVSDKEMRYTTVNLAGLEIKDCIQCNYCFAKQKPGRYCSLKDDAQEIFEKIESADIIVLASPVYFMRTSARMAALIDRLRVFIFGNLVKGKLKNKIGVSAAVSWMRHGGMETTHLSHIYAFLTLEMIPVSAHKGISLLGASAVASIHGSGDFDPAVRLGINEDESGLDSAKAIMERAVELVRLLKK
jgi:multimeric flavodoxin WrbA